MSVSRSGIESHLKRLLQGKAVDQAVKQLAPKLKGRPARVPGASLIDTNAIERRWQMLQAPGKVQAMLWDDATRQSQECYQHNIEYFIGTVKVPVGIAGPLRVNGTCAEGDFFVPLATTEAALVASYNRGALLITEAGGCSAILLNEGVSRAPAFAFAAAVDAGRFVLWITEHFDDLKTAAEATTRHGKLMDIKITLEGNHVYLQLEYHTGDASGQNMVTIATQAVCAFIENRTPVKPEYWFVEANISGDKKATAQSFQSVRGKKVTADVTIPAELIRRRLHTTPDVMMKYWQISSIGTVMAGSIGIHGHYANGLAAFYLACGQDVACVAESAIGITRFELRPNGDLYASVTLPNLMIGTVGGGTGLPSQRACLDLMGLAGTGKAKALAEVAASVVLAGELSIVGALAAHEFSRAHARLARGQRATNPCAKDQA